MKKGITLAILSIVILLMIILITTVTTTGTMAINNSKKMKFASELALVQELSDEYANNNEGKYPVSSSIEIDLENVTTTAIKQFDDEVKNGSKIILYKIDFSLLGKTDLVYGNKKNGDTTDIYAVSKDTEKVYYVKGLKVGKNTYYTLTDDLKLSIDYTPNTGSVTKDGIVFNTIKSKWTNQNIKSVVKIPSNLEYTNISVLVIKDNGSTITTIEPSENKQGYDVYNIENVTGNYEIKVEYTKDGNSLFQTFKVENFDSEAPKFVVEDIKQMVNQKDNVKQTYISVDIKSDTSGIKYAKYEIDNISESDAKLYFTNNGMQIKDGTIIVDKYTTNVTIYVEDNAGNFSTEVVNLDTVLSDNDYVKEGLVLQYDGINNTGNGHSDTANIWKDLSGNGNDGTLVGIDGTDTSGWTNNCLKLDGINDYVYKNMGLDKYNCTIEVVYKYYDGANVFKTDVNGNLVLDTGMKQEGIQISRFDVENALSACIMYNKETQDTIKITAFQNCNSKSSVTTNIVNGNYITLGANLPDSASEFAKADIYAVRIYNRVLTQEEIKQNYKIDKYRFGI